MSALKLPRTLIRLLDLIVLQGLPEEVCGMFGGRDNVVTDLVPIPNVSPAPQTSFLMDPQALIDTLMNFEERDIQLLAIYHSHPPGSIDILSTSDVDHAHYPDSLYLLALPSSDLNHVDYRLFEITRSKEVRQVTLEVI